ncbi:MAG TPA: HDOD domain-containing protein [Verrucomicrobiae bacterium]|nr:HDOD domain-containing protein [Verrucomicrobiae bacterium]
MEALKQAPKPARENARGVAAAAFPRLAPAEPGAQIHRVDRVIERVTQLPFSPVATKILHLAWDERAGARDMANVIVLDQAFTARLLRIANSPYYGQSREVTTVSQAVAILGMDAIASLALTLFTFGTVPEDGNETLSIGQLWEHSLGTAVWARAIAARANNRMPEEAFIAGMLHDMGKVLLYRFFKKELHDAVRMAENDGISLAQAEQQILGTDHVVVGHVAATQWGFPPVLRYAIAFHRAPQEVPRDTADAVKKIVAIIHVADALTEATDIGYGGGDSSDRAIDASIWPLLRTSEEECRQMVDQVTAEIEKNREKFAAALGWKQTAKKERGEKTANEAEKSASRIPPIAPAARAQNAAYFDRFIEAGKQIAVLAGLDEMLPNIASHAMMLLEADAAEILLPKDEVFEFAAAVGIESLRGRTIPAAQSLAGWVAQIKEAMMIADIERAPISWEKSYFADADYRTHLLLPIEWAGKTIAVLEVHRRRASAWKPEDLSAFNTFVELAAVALENARLYRESEEKAVSFQKVNQALHEALRVKEKFLHIVSHELRTPLSIIMAYPGMVLNNLFGDTTPQIRDGMQKVLGSAKHLLTMIDTILDLTQIEGKQMKVHLEEIDLPKLLDEIAAAAEERIAEKSVVFERDYPRSLPVLATDRKRLKQALMCLVDNAAKFTHEGKIVLGAARKQGGVEIFVRDTGIGIEEKCQEIIFDPFRQIDDGDDRSFGGLGLGLYTARSIARLIQGDITVESRVDKGSIFRVWIPRLFQVDESSSANV